MKSLKKIIYLLTRHEKVRAVWLLIMILSMALIDMMGIASIMPFIALLTNPEIIETNTILNFAYQKGKIFGIENEHQFLIAIGVFVFLLLIISITFKALTTYIQARFIKMCEYTIAKRLVERYLNQPYSWFLNRNSANLGKSILSEVGNVVGRGLEPMMSLVTNSLITFTLFFLLFVVEPKLSLIVIVIVCTFYGVVYKLNRNLMDRMGKENFKANESKFKVLNEAFGASKEVKVGGLEQIFINQFSKPAKIIAYNSAVVAILSQIPRYTLEAIAFGGMLLIILYFMTTAGDITNVLPIIALYAFAGYRLMPAIQKIYIALTYIRIVGPAVNSLYDDFKNLNRSVENKSKDTLKLNKDIRLNNIHYNYPNASKTALKNINLKIPAYSTIGLVGATGSGKTTTVDIILGLLQSQKGTLEVDGKIINNDNRRAWQHSIGYVPQQIFLVDNTVASNIAFGKDIARVQLDISGVDAIQLPIGNSQQRPTGSLLNGMLRYNSELNILECHVDGLWANISTGTNTSGVPNMIYNNLNHTLMRTNTDNTIDILVNQTQNMTLLLAQLQVT